MPNSFEKLHWVGRAFAFVLISLKLTSKEFAFVTFSTPSLTLKGIVQVIVPPQTVKPVRLLPSAAGSWKLAETKSLVV